MVKVKIVPINEIISKTISNIQTRIDNTGEVNVKMNIGETTRDSFLIKYWT